MRQTRHAWPLPLICLLAACGQDSSDAGFSDTAGDKSAANDADGGAATSGGASATPPEKEVESSYEAPVATGNVVWIANPTSGRVALVDATTLAVRTVEAGDGPTYVASVPNQPVDTTLVINVNSDDATLLKSNADGSIASTTFKTADGLNAMAFSADGRFAIVWADARKVANAPDIQGFQDLTVCDLTTGVATTLAVGYRPVAVGFGGQGAYAVTQDGIALIDLSGKPVETKNVAISDDPNEDPGTRDVFVTKDAARAFIRRDDSSVITIVTLASGARTDLTLSGPVTDLDLSDTGDRAVAVIRSNAEADIITIADPSHPDAIAVTGETIGSVSIAPGGTTALLYTNAIADEHVTILSLLASPTPTFRTVKLYSPVLAVFPTPDAQNAVVLHDTSGSAAEPGAFSLVPIGQNLPAKIVATEAKPTAVATINDRAIVAESDGTSVYGAYLARFPQMMVDRFDLATPPIAIGIVATARRAYVAQNHPEGRLTFIDLDTGVARTLTGFELSSRVVDGSGTP